MPLSPSHVSSFPGYLCQHHQHRRLQVYTGVNTFATNPSVNTIATKSGNCQRSPARALLTVISPKTQIPSSPKVLQRHVWIRSSKFMTKLRWERERKRKREREKDRQTEREQQQLKNKIDALIGTSDFASWANILFNSSIYGEAAPAPPDIYQNPVVCIHGIAIIFDYTIYGEAVPAPPNSFSTPPPPPPPTPPDETVNPP